MYIRGADEVDMEEDIIKELKSLSPSEAAIEGVLYLLEGKDALIDTMTHNEEVLMEELDKKTSLINTMQSEFDRLEDLEDDTDMLKFELKKKNKMIDLMAEELTTPIHSKEWVKGYYEDKAKGEQSGE